VKIRSLAVTHLSEGRVVVVTPPASPAVTTADARAHCRVVHAHHDAMLASLVGVASAWLEGPTGWLGRSLVTRTLDLELAAFPWAREAALQCGPVSTLSAVTYRDAANVVQTRPVSGVPVVTYRDAANVVQTLDAALHFRVGDTLVFHQGWTAPATYPRPDAVVVRYTAGYGDATALPLPVRQALLLLVGHHYENREAATPTPQTALPFAVESLLTPWRKFQ